METTTSRRALSWPLLGFVGMGDLHSAHHSIRKLEHKFEPKASWPTAAVLTVHHSHSNEGSEVRFQGYGLPLT